MRHAGREKLCKKPKRLFWAPNKSAESQIFQIPGKGFSASSQWAVLCLGFIEVVLVFALLVPLCGTLALGTSP